MQHENSVLHALLKQIPWPVFDQLVTAHDGDKHVRRLTSKSQLIALLYAQLAGADSLRAIELGLRSHQHRLYHLGASTVARSTLADANAKRPAQLFADLFAHLLAQAHRGLRRKMGEAVRLIDATGLPLNSHSADWAQL